MSAGRVLWQALDAGVQLRAEHGQLGFRLTGGRLDDGLARELKTHKAEILELFEPGRRYGLTSFAQQRLWFLYKLVPESAAYNISFTLRLVGDLRHRVMERALAAVVSRHEILRTTFDLVEERPVQVIHPPAPCTVPVVDLSGLPAARRVGEARRLADAETLSPFTLEDRPPMRCYLVRSERLDHLLLVNLHHIITDTWSMSIFFDELARLYDGLSAGRAPDDVDLEALPLQYADYAAWQKRWLSGENFARQLRFWKSQVGEDPPLLELPTDRPRPRVPRFRGEMLDVELPAGLSRAARALARSRGATLAMTFLAAFFALLHRVTGLERMLVGAPVAGRNRSELERLQGFFINALVVAGDLRPEPGEGLDFHRLLARVKATSLEVYQNQDMPFEKLVEELGLARDLARNPLFQVAFVFQNAPGAELALRGLEVESLPLEFPTSRFDVELHLWEAGERFQGLLMYDVDLFDRATAERWKRHYAVLLGSLTAEPGRDLTELRWLTAAEEHELRVEWNDVAEGSRHEADSPSVAELFARRAAAAPAAVALSVERGDQLVTYGELRRRVAALSDRLVRRGAAPETVVGVLSGRGAGQVTAFLAVLEAAGAYLPLDPELPADRLRFMLRDTGSTLVLAAAATARRCGELPAGVETVPLEEGPTPAGPIVTVESAARPDHLAPDNLAYVLYTSGSTGRPKGVAIRHRSLLYLVRWHRDAYGVGPDDRAAQVAPVGFDLSVWEIASTLAWGATLHLPAEATRLDPGRLAAYLRRTGVTVGNLATPLTEALLGEDLSGLPLRVLLTGGDRLRPVDRPLPFPLINHYGPTENTVIATRARVSPESPLAPPIGRPLGRSVAYLVDAHGRSLPIGVPGEIRIGGETLARGYFGRPALTGERFVPDPFAGPGGRLYRTGDLARRRGDGQLDFLGRTDHQVKLRGQRIELGEIERALHRLPGLAEAVVVLRSDGDEGRLVAFVTAAAAGPHFDRERFLAGLGAALRRRLPPVMVPADFVVLEALPRTPSGKIDRRALPRRVTRQATVAKPRAGLEATLAGIWRDVLGVEEIGIDSNFFELGGSSLALLRVRERLRRELGPGREPAVVDLFQHPTVRALAEHLAPASAAETAARDRVRRPEPPAPRNRPRRLSPEDAGDRIAIVAMAVRFPGSRDVGELWRNLEAGVESISFFDDDEIAAAVPPEVLGRPDFVKAGGVLDGVDLFDAEFFDFTPAEAALLDPQHRLFFEAAWEALERCACDPTRHRGRIGVFAGVGASTYLSDLVASGAAADPATSFELGLANSPANLPTRVSYKFDLKGPSVAVQTACSTSLVTVNMACESLAAGFSDLALAGGVSIHVPQKSGHFHQPGMIFSPDGHCRSFDARAGGTVFGNGVGVVALKRLADAVADRDPIHAVVLGWATNNDGARKVGYTAPGIEGQTAAVRDALEMAGIDPDTVGYVEAHGTATELGDPIEVAALTRAFRERTARTGFCALGSIKSNLGHLDNAAGVAGLVKAALSLEHRRIVPSLHFERSNPEIDFAATPFYVSTAAADWPAGGHPRRAGVSAFGIGGTNAHTVLEEPPPRPPSGASRPRFLLPLSARTPAALDQLGRRLAEHLERHPELDLADAAYTLSVGRRRFDHRRIAVAAGREEALELLAAADPERTPGRHDATSRRPVVFLFPGHGSQYVGMGSGLYRDEPVYRREVDRCAEILEPLLGHDVRRLLLPPAGAEEEVAGELTHPELSHPAIFTVEYALARLWTSWGIVPAAVVGHSAGEYAAACAAGVLGLEDALRMTRVRGRLSRDLPPGAMLGVFLPAAEVEALLDLDPDGGLAVAAVNTADQCTVAGPAAAVDALAARLAERGVEYRHLHTAFASHCSLVDGALDAIAAAARTLELRRPEIPFLSSVTGTWLSDDEALDPAYWARHMRSQVRFAEALDALGGEEPYLFLEVAPGRTLTTFVGRQRPAAARGLVLPSLPHPRERHGDLAFILGTLGRLWLAGAEVDWQAFYAGEERRREVLPTYPFERRRHWIEGRAPLRGARAPASPAAAGVAPAAAPRAEGPGAEAPRDALEARVLALWRELLGIPELGPHDHFFEAGGSSLLAVRLLSRVNRLFAVSMSPHALLETPSAASLARAIAERLGPAPGPAAVRPWPDCVVELVAGRSGSPPLFLVHAVGGHVYSYRELAEALELEEAVYGIRALGTEPGEEPLPSIEAMAARYVEAVLEVDPEGPYRIAGHSMGGAIAYEMACRLIGRGREVGFLALLDTPGPGQQPAEPESDAELLSMAVEGRFEPEDLDAEDPVASLIEKWREAGAEAPVADPAEIRRWLGLLRVHFRATCDYRPGRFPGRLTFFRARRRGPADPPHPELPWIEAAEGGVEVQVVPGTHLTMDRGENLPELARRFGAALAASRPSLDIQRSGDHNLVPLSTEIHARLSAPSADSQNRRTEAP